MSEEKNWEWAVEDRPHGTFLLSNGGYPIAMISSAGPGHIIDTAAKIAEALNAHERRLADEALEKAHRSLSPTDGAPANPPKVRTP